MANPTSNFGWQMPTNTDLVKDLPADFEVFGQAVDTSLMDLKGGTTGQVLSKASNTDMDFTWVTSDDADAIQNTIVDAKGDLIAASAADTPARLAVGNNGESLFADSSASTGLRWQGNFAAGKNKLINGDFTINQRNFTSATASNTYTFDRWLTFITGDGTATYTPQTFTPGTAPVTGYEGANFYRVVTASQTSTAVRTAFRQRIEDVRNFAGQTITVSFWAKAASGTPKIGLAIQRVYGTGGSPSSAEYLTPATPVTISTSWTRYSFTISIPSLSGKTLGTDANSSSLGIVIPVSVGSDFTSELGSVGIQNNTFDIWGVQAEAGSVATPFQTATGTLAGELAAAQRYYFRCTSGSLYGYISNLLTATSTTKAIGLLPMKAPMRVTPTAVDYSTIQLSPDDATVTSVTSITINGGATAETPLLTFNVASGLTQFRPYFAAGNNSTTAFIGLSAEL